ncbi:MAG: acyl-CoA thioesterase [Bacteroidota bacterium]|jgi:acyl-CoA thioester hydrolase|nr:thioesterase family protein [Chitinophagaceae bacterium]
MNNKYLKAFEFRWSDVDANQHVMHSKYYEAAAHCRMSFLKEKGITMELLKSLSVGPILFREECSFRRELYGGEIVQVSFELLKAKRDGSRFSTIHEFTKSDGTLAATLHADLAWINTEKRKLTAPPAEVIKMMEDSPKHADFIFID